MKSIAILTLPKVEPNGPLLGPAILKGALEQENIECHTLDFNIYLYNQNKDVWKNSIDDPKPSIDYFKRFVFEEIEPLDVDVIGLSVFSHLTVPAVKLICVALRMLCPDKTILLGGPAFSAVSDQAKAWVWEFKEEDLFDDFISGDAEKTIVQYMNGVIQAPGINNFDYIQSPTMDDLPYPNYDDVNFDLYEEQKKFHMSGSRGCVRQCAFCNVPLIWKYKGKSGDRLADETIALVEKYGINYVRYVDSLINGNQKQFKIFLERIAKWRKETGSDFGWESYFIFRDRKDPDLIPLLIESGCNKLFVGIESGNEQIRINIQKPFSNDSIKWHCDEFERHGAKDILIMLMIVGFPSEGEEEFNDSMDMLDFFAQYECIDVVSSSHPLLVIPDTPLFNDMEDYGVNNYKDGWNWDGKDHNYEIRKRRYEAFLAKKGRLGL